MKMTNRILSVLIALVLIINCFSPMAQTASADGIPQVLEVVKGGKAKDQPYADSGDVASIHVFFGEPLVGAPDKSYY